jgi:hypothetical protein
MLEVDQLKATSSAQLSQAEALADQFKAETAAVADVRAQLKVSKDNYAQLQLQHKAAQGACVCSISLAERVKPVMQASLTRSAREHPRCRLNWSRSRRSEGLLTVKLPC